MNSIQKIAFGGGCHWCTEAVFQSLTGVISVEQGFVASDGDHKSFSEAVVVTYKPGEISLKDLVLIHLFTHESTVQHSLRDKYRSAIYTLRKKDVEALEMMWPELQSEFSEPLITETLPLKEFKASHEMFHNYYYSNPEKPFCKKYIHPKLQMLRHRFSKHLTPKTA